MVAPGNPVPTELTDELVEETAAGLYRDYTAYLTNNGYTAVVRQVGPIRTSLADVTPHARIAWRTIARHALLRVLPDTPDPTNPWAQSPGEDTPNA